MPILVSFIYAAAAAAAVAEIDDPLLSAKLSVYHFAAFVCRHRGITPCGLSNSLHYFYYYYNN